MITTLFVLSATSLAIGYGWGVRANRLPFTAKIGFSEKQEKFLQKWVKLALVAGVLLPIGLFAQAWGQPFSGKVWGNYLLIVAVQLVSERFFSQWFVPSVVVPIGFFYTAFRLWQLLDGFTHLAWSPWTGIGFSLVVLFWAANLVMLTVMAIPTIFIRSSPISDA
ncbi:MAG TPA: hypothetical protein VL134_00315 [Leptolyngbya sp.]|nr:hypothetical protein [Leptolyngbya sp.]